MCRGLKNGTRRVPATFQAGGGTHGRFPDSSRKLAFLPDLREQHREHIDGAKRVAHRRVERFDHVFTVRAANLVVPGILGGIPLRPGGLLAS